MKQVGQVAGHLVVRWLEMLGQNPPPARDHGICAWQYLQTRRHRPAACPPAVGGQEHFVDEPCMPAGLRN